MKTALGVLLVAALGAPALAQSTPAPVRPSAPAAQQVSPSEITISGWQLQCDSRGGSGLNCQALDEVTARRNNAVISAVSVRQTPDKKPIILVQVPLGIALQDGIRVGFENGAVQAMPAFTCNNNGCMARAAIGDPLLNAMRAAKQPLRIAYENLDGNLNKQTITIVLGLDGFSAAYDKLR